ncbi:MAG: response regulator transcription factor, partial [Armatimonadota bacterium]|nr:response regulator transcription factor [bacterium]
EARSEQYGSGRAVMRILIVDDDANLIEGLRWYLEAEGYEVIAATDGEVAVQTVRESHPDLVILDIMMPKMDGIKACEVISSESDAMIMMLSARDSDIDKVRALKIGADDYVTKPFNVSELVARIQALLRRRSRSHVAAPAYRWRDLELSLDEHRVKVNGSVVELSTMEYDLLAALMEHPQIVLTREQLVETIWGEDFYGEFRLVDNLVCRVREKLTGAGCIDFPIATVRGVGYAYRPAG